MEPTEGSVIVPEFCPQSESRYGNKNRADHDGPLDGSSSCGSSGISSSSTFRCTGASLETFADTDMIRSMHDVPGENSKMNVEVDWTSAYRTLLLGVTAEPGTIEQHVRPNIAHHVTVNVLSYPHLRGCFALQNH